MMPAARLDVSNGAEGNMIDGDGLPTAAAAADTVGESSEEEPVLVHASESNLIYRAVVSWERLLEDGGGGSTTLAAASPGDGDAATVPVAIKSLASPCNPSAEDLSCLHNEYNVLSRHLSDCSAARRALRTERRPPAEGGPAVYLEWSEGESLQSWIDGREPPPPAPSAAGMRRRRTTPMSNLVKVPSQSQPQSRLRKKKRNGDGGDADAGSADDSSSSSSSSSDGDITAGTDDSSVATSPQERAWRDDLLLRCRVAKGLAGALAQVHEAGVVHNDVFADNIMVSFESRSGGGGRKGERKLSTTPPSSSLEQDEDQHQRYPEKEARKNSELSEGTTKKSNQRKRQEHKQPSKDEQHGKKDVKIQIIDFGFASLAAGNELTDYDLNDYGASAAADELGGDAEAYGGGGYGDCAECEEYQEEGGGTCNDDIYALGNVLRDLFLGKGGQIALRNETLGGGGSSHHNQPPVGLSGLVKRRGSLGGPADDGNNDGRSLVGFDDALQTSVASLASRTSRSSSLVSSCLTTSVTTGGRNSSLLSRDSAGALNVAAAGGNNIHNDHNGGGSGRGGMSYGSRRRSSFIFADELGVPTFHTEGILDSDDDDDDDDDHNHNDEGGGGKHPDKGRPPQQRVGGGRGRRGNRRLKRRRYVPQPVADLVSNLMVSTGGGTSNAFSDPFGSITGSVAGSSHFSSAHAASIVANGGGGQGDGHLGGELTPISVASDPYRTARELHDDLDQMLSDPDTFLFDHLRAAGGGDGGGDAPAHVFDGIELPEGRLYGKDREIASLIESYVRVCDDGEGGKSECVLVSGAAGTGKSTLIRTLRKLVIRRGGYYVSGKFDQLRGDEPYSALLSGFGEFCDVVLKKGPEVASEMGRVVRKAVGSRGRAVMTEMVPGFADLVAAGKGDGDDSDDDDASRQRGFSIGSESDAISAAAAASAAAALDQVGSTEANTLETVSESRQHLDRLGSTRSILDGGGDATTSSGNKRRPSATSDFSHNRLHRAFRMFARAISTPDHPVVLVLDDLQWADEASLNLVKSLVADPDNASFLFVGSYRDDEVRCSRPLQSFLTEVENMERQRQRESSSSSSGRDLSCTSQGGGPSSGGVIRMTVGNLDLDASNALVSECLRLTKRITKPLAEILHRKTHGNVLFIVQFLRSFRDDGLILYRSPELRRWKWDLERARTMNPAENVAGLLAEKIRALPGEAGEVVRLAACLGSYFDGGTLRRLVADSRREAADKEVGGQSGGDDSPGRKNIQNRTGGLERVLRSLIAEGMIDRAPEAWRHRHPHQGASSPQYKFSHDRIQQAAYSLVPEEERGRLHLRIGNLILKDASLEPSSQSSASASRASSPAAGGVLLFTAVDQLNRGTSHLTTSAERIEVASLNLRAGERAVQASAFGPAASYLRRGIDLLGDGGDKSRQHWSERYDLSLRLYCALAESEYCNCRFDVVETVAGEVLERARTVDDAMPAYWSLIKSRGAGGNNVEAAALGFDVLEKLGEKFPKPDKISKAFMLKDVAKTKLLLRGKSDEDLAGLPVMTDPVRVSAMQLLTSLFAYGHYVRPEYGVLVANRMVRISVKHGACEGESAFAFASYGCILAATQEFKSAVRYGNLALSLVRRFDAKDWIAHVYAIAHGTVLHWSEPLDQTLDPLLYSCRMGLEAGDNEYAMYSVMDYCVHSFYCGRPLVGLEGEMRTYCRQMVEYGQDAAHALTAPYWQTVLNLMGCGSDGDGDDPTVLTGDAMDQDILMGEADAKGNHLATSIIAANRFYLAYTMGNYTLARDLAEKCVNLPRVASGMFVAYHEEFYYGLLCFALAREDPKKSKRKTWAKRGRKSAKKVEAWATVSPANWRHKATLLEAEAAAVAGKAEKAAAHFERAVSAANAGGFLHEEALAYERGGVFFAEVENNEHMASRYFARAQELYLLWGAKAKAELLRTRHASLVVPGRRRRSFQVFKKRRCAGRMTAHVSPNGIR